MIKIFRKTAMYMFVILLAMAPILAINTSSAYAEEKSYYGFGVSPMKEKIILNPGDTYSGSFEVTNPAKNTIDFDYKIAVSPFFVTDNYDIIYEESGDLNQIVKWIKLDGDSGTLKPNETNEIKFKINVPMDAPAGGQYAAIVVQSKEGDTNTSVSTDTGVQINQGMGIAHTIFAEVAGTSIHSGKILSVNLPGFMMGGKISGSTTIENNGNVHGDAVYKLQVFPLFSSEEIYTNEEDPDTSIVLPGRTRYHETVWDETPMVGIFNAIYTVEFEGVTQQISRLVIICPLWLLFIIIFAIMAIVVWLVIRIKMRKKAED